MNKTNFDEFKQRQSEKQEEKKKYDPQKELKD